MERKHGYPVCPWCVCMCNVSYISKAQTGMSELLRQACTKARKGNSSIKQQVRDIGSKFLNSVKISAQEAVYTVLQLPVKKSSRQVVLIKYYSSWRKSAGFKASKWHKRNGRWLWRCIHHWPFTKICKAPFLSWTPDIGRLGSYGMTLSKGCW